MPPRSHASTDNAQNTPAPDYVAERGPDGTLHPYPEPVVTTYLATAARAYAHRTPAQRRASAVVTPDLLEGGRAPRDAGALVLIILPRRASAGSLGARCTWWVVEGETVIATGALERDVEYEAEGGEPAWVTQSAFVAAAWRRRGVYRAVLLALRRHLALPLLPDTQQTAAASGAWRAVESQVLSASALQSIQQERAHAARVDRRLEPLAGRRGAR